MTGGPPDDFTTNKPEDIVPRSRNSRKSMAGEGARSSASGLRHRASAKSASRRSGHRRRERTGSANSANTLLAPSAVSAAPPTGIPIASGRRRTPRSGNRRDKRRRHKTKHTEDKELLSVDVETMGLELQAQGLDLQQAQGKRRAPTHRMHLPMPMAHTPQASTPAATSPAAPTPRGSPRAADEPPAELVVDKSGFVQTLVDLGVRGLCKEFARMKAEDKARPPAAEPPTPAKNRYKNILCLHAGKVAGGIYHANEVDPQIIMAQAPMTHTLNAFWQLIIKERVDMIVQMIPSDNGTRCASYCQGFFGSVTVTEEKKHHPCEPGVQMSFLKAKCAASGARANIVNLAYCEWPQPNEPDEAGGGKPGGGERRAPHRLIPDPESPALVELWHATRAAKRLLVICASGAGRSAVYVLVHQMLQLLRDQKPIQPVQMVRQLRDRRHMAMRSELKFLFCIRCVLCHLMKNNGAELSQGLLQTVDDYDAFVRKQQLEDRELRKARALAGPDMLSELSNEPCF